MNFEEIYQKFHQQIANVGYDAKTPSVQISHFPVPTVIVGDVDINGIFKAKKLSIKFSILSILTLNPSIDLITASDVDISVTGVNKLQHETTLIRLFQILPELVNIDMKNVRLHDRHADTTENIAFLHIRPHDTYNVVVNWTDRLSTLVSYNKQAAHLEVKIATTAPEHKVEFVETYDETYKLLSGTISYKIGNLRDYISENYMDLDLLITQIASKESIQITCDFAPTDNGMAVRNINLTSNSLGATGSADLSADTKQDVWNLSFTKINLNNLLKAPDMDSITASKNKAELKLKDLNSIVNLTADNITVGDFLVSGVKAKASSDGTKLNIDECSGLIDTDGTFDLAGSVTQNQYRSKFDGKINLTYPNVNDIMTKIGYRYSQSSAISPLSIKSDIIATPIDYKLTNLVAKMGTIGANGSAAVKLIGDTPRINLALNFSPIDFESKEYAVISPMMDYFKSLTLKMHEKEYADKFIPLRKIGYLGNFDIGLMGPIIGGKSVDKIHFICDVSAGMLNFTSIYYQDGPDNLTGGGKLISTGLKPMIVLHIDDGELYTDSLSLSNIISAVDHANTRYSFDRVSLDFAIALKHLKQGTADFKNFYVAAINDNQLFNISALQGYYNTGSFSSSGSIFLDSMSLNLAYAYTNFNIKDLNPIYPTSIFGITDGWVSSNGTISATGDTLAKWIYSFYTKSDFVASAVKWSGFDMDGLAKLANTTGYDSTNLAKDAATYASSGNFNIEKISGGYEVNQGVIKFSDVTFNTNIVTGTAIASYNIYSSDLDATITTAFSLPPTSRYNSPEPVDVIVHSYGNISSLKKDVNVDKLQHALGKRWDGSKNANPNRPNIARPTPLHNNHIQTGPHP